MPSKRMEQKNSDKPKLPKVESGDYYLNNEGLMVFTKKYHLKRGYCCESGCKHCPYGFEKQLSKSK